MHRRLYHWIFLTIATLGLINTGCTTNTSPSNSITLTPFATLTDVITSTPKPTVTLAPSPSFTSTTTATNTPTPTSTPILNMQGSWQQITEADGLCTNSPRFVGDKYIGTNTTTLCAPGDENKVWRTFTVPLGTIVYGWNKFPPGGGEEFGTDEGVCIRSDIGWECDVANQTPYNQPVYEIKRIDYMSVLRLKDSIVYMEKVYRLEDIIDSIDVNATSLATIIRNEATAVEFDFDAEIWVGTDTAGVIRIFPEPAIQHTTENGLPSNDIRDIEVGDHVWAATNAGVSEWDGNSWTTYTTENGLPSNNVNGLTEYRGTVWVATTNGAAYLNGSEWQAFTAEEGIPIGDLTDVRLNGANEVWFTTHANGLIIFTIEI